MREITNAYDAWWFIFDHPKLNRPLRIKHDENQTYGDSFRKRWTLVEDKGGHKWWHAQAACDHALEINLDVFYAKVDETRVVNDDKTKNVNVEVWLEFGPVKYGYYTDWMWKNKEPSHEINCHDWELDCGAPTFDEALVELANLVLQRYGDYEEETMSAS